MGQRIDTAIVAARLVRNAVRYRYLRLTARPGRPQAVSLEVTHRCVCRCVMCNIWMIPDQVADLSLEEWRQVLESDLLDDVRELDITGGEPFLRDDLVSLVEFICSQKQARMGQLRSVAITTNGILSERVVGMVSEMLQPMRAAGLELIIVCALDALDETHDRIRRHAGAWRKADDCIARLRALRSANPHLIIGVKTTVLPDNVDQLEDIAAYAAERGLFTIISPAITTRGRYLNADRAERLTLDPVARAALARFYEGSSFQWSYHARALADFLSCGRMKKPCSCGFNYFFVRSTGDVHLCPLMEETIGNVRRDAIEQLFLSRRGRTLRGRVGRATECAVCTEPGLERYSLPFEGLAYLGTMLRLGPHAFLALHRHLGLDKYL